MADNQYLRIVYQVLRVSILAVLLISVFADTRQPQPLGAPRLVGIFLIAIEVLVWVWLTDYKFREGVW